MEHPDFPAKRSVAGAGDLADVPADEDGIKIVHAEDEDGNVVGLAIRWGGTEWFWANASSFDSLEDMR